MANRSLTAKAVAKKLWQADEASRALGMDVSVAEPGAAIACMTVRSDMTNGMNACHGGLVFALADTAFAFACNGQGEIAVAASAHIDFLRPSYEGDRLRAVASEDHSGRKTGYYTVIVRNQNEETVALFRGRSVRTGKNIDISDT